MEPKDDSQEEHNKKLLADLTPGDLIEFPKWFGIYSHWVVYVGNGMVVHLMPSHSGAASSNESGEGIVKLDDLTTAAGKSKGRINNEKDARFPPLPRQAIVRRAVSRVGEEGEYNVNSNNCEHFASSCRNQQAVSDQISRGNAVKRFVLAKGPVVADQVLTFSQNFSALGSEERAPYAGEKSVGSAAEDRTGPLDLTDRNYAIIRQISLEPSQNSSLHSLNNLPLSSERPRQTYLSVERNSFERTPLSSALDPPSINQYIPPPSSMVSLNNLRSSEPTRRLETYLSQTLPPMPSFFDGNNSSPLSMGRNERLGF